MANSIIQKSLASELINTNTTVTWDDSYFTAYHNRVAKYGRMVVIWWNLYTKTDIPARTAIGSLPYSSNAWTLVWLPAPANVAARGYISGSTIYCEQAIAGGTSLAGMAIYFTND